MKFIQKLYYKLFRTQKKKIYQKRDEIKLSIRVKKNDLSLIERSDLAEKVFSEIETLKQFEKSKKILMFWSHDVDFPSQDFILKWSEKKDILLPSISHNKITINKFVKMQETTSENKKKYSPITKPYHGSIDLAIIPAIAFDKEKYRMGQGKGYYKDFFKFKNVYTIGVGFDFQIIESIPSYWQDLKLDRIVTPNQTWT